MRGVTGPGRLIADGKAALSARRCRTGWAAGGTAAHGAARCSAEGRPGPAQPAACGAARPRLLPTGITSASETGAEEPPGDQQPLAEQQPLGAGRSAVLSTCPASQGRRGSRGAVPLG